MKKVETHLHTAPNSNCAIEQPRDIARIVGHAGYDAVIVTNHVRKDIYDNWRRMGFDPVDKYLEAYRELRGKVTGQDRPGRFFLRADGRPLYPMLVCRLVHGRLEAAGAVGKLSPHVLRHTFASVMLNNGAEINSVKEILGHESLAATQVYTHITFSELKSNYKLAHPRALKKEVNYGSKD